MIFLYVLYFCFGQINQLAQINKINHNRNRLLANEKVDCKYNSSLKLVPSINMCYTEVCPEDYSSSVGITLRNTTMVVVCFNNSQWECAPQCYGCYPAAKSACVSCQDSKKRGMGMAIDYQTILNMNTLQCQCNSGFEENEPKNGYCKCPDGKYIDDYLPEMQLCLACVSGCKICTSGKSCQQCITGIGRSQDTSKLCKCVDGYIEQEPVVADCKKACQQPCFVCIDGSNVQCQTCMDSSMTINTQKLCVCPSKYYYSQQTNYMCQPCAYTCLTCNGPALSNCLSCSPDSFRVYQFNQCSCPQYYSDVNGKETCIVCDWTCATCSTTTTCDSCPPDSFRIQSNSLCYCQPGYANDLNSVNCVKCLYSCDTCDETFDTCVTCPQNSFRELVNSQCLCPIKYYDDKTAECQTCDFSCLTCIDGQPSSCLTCDSTKNRYLQDGYCKCISGYGYIDDQTEECQVCSQNCITCSQIDSCLTCDTSDKRVLSVDNKCVCDSFYADIDSKCQKCYYTCKSCQDTTREGCLTCNYDNGFLMRDNNQCGCDDGYFDFYQVCNKCYYQCLTCINRYSDGCITCPDSRVRSDLSIAASSCICSTQQYIDDGINMECQPCHYSCYTCSGGKDNNCLSCFDNQQIPSTISRQLVFGSCQCPDKWLDDQTNEACTPCHASCLKCFDNTEYGCLTCSPQEFRMQLSNSCFCLDGYFEDLQFTCNSCDYRCQTCKLDATNCLTCLNGSNRFLAQQDSNQDYQICKCPPLYPNDVQGNPICQPCHFSCQNCSTQEINTCTLCDSNSQRYLSQDNTGSYCLCKLSYYEVGNAECASCSSYCLGCVTNSDNCQSCNQDDYRELNNTTCVCAVRFGAQLLSYYENNPREPTCLACHYSCQTCNGPNNDNCLTCSDLDFRLQQTSYCACKPSYIDLNERICQQCDYQCQTCEIAKSLCTSCPPSSLRTLNPSTQSCDCPSGYYDNQTPVCDLCDINCQSCTNTSTTCLSCKINTNRTYNNLSYSCDCYQGYYDNLDGTCQKCHFSCISCTGPLNTDCIVCPEYTVTQRVKTVNQCICPDGYFDDGINQICPQCSITCLTCETNKNNCSNCIDGQNRQLHQNQCICKDQYFDSGSSICEQCNPKCQKCQLISDYCTQCDLLLNRELNTRNNFCDCQIGYFDNGGLLCQQCNIKCLSCVNASDNCTSCDVNSYRKLSQSQCSCIPGTLDSGLQSCLLCDKKCLTCQNTISNCTSCDAILNRVLLENKCQCQVGYYEDANMICQLCDSLCLECNSNTGCTKCDSLQNRTLNYLGKCVCLNGYFENTSQLCQKCSSNCLNCYSSQSNCITCNANRYLSSNQCLCIDGLYDDGNNNCLSCDFKCQKCDISSTNCLSCYLNSNREFKNNQCNCADGYYDQGSQNCIQCDQSCLTCSGGINNCTSCNQLQNRQLVGQQCNCIDGYYDQHHICEKCQYSCNTCESSATKCTSCVISNTFRLDQSSGFYQCPCLPGFFDNGSLICQSINPLYKECSYKCLNCKLSLDNCTACNQNLGNNRINQIPSCECQAGYFDDGIQIECQKCSNRCQSCTLNQSNCTQCESQEKRDAAPQCNCKDGFYIDNNLYCQPCQANCLTCTQSKSNCITCQPDRIGKQCQCQQGYFEKYVQTCQSCNYKCATCADDQLNCLSCKGDRMNPPNCVCQDHFYDDFVQQNCQVCNQNCNKCDINGCINCAANRILNNNQCDCPISSISYTDTPYCSNCDVAVVNGYFSDDLTMIQYEFEYKLQFNFDVMVSEQEYCSKLFLKETLIKLGQKPLCQIDDKILNIQLGDGATINVGDMISFNSSQLKHDDCLNPFQLITRTIIKNPINLLKPQVQLQYPLSSISPCQSLQILIIQMQINAGRNLQLKWDIQLTQDNNLMDIISLANIQQLQTLSFPQSSLPELSNISFTLTFTNLLQQTNQIAFNINTLSYQTPSFTFTTTKIKYFSWIPIQIQTSYDNSICQNKKILQLSNPVKITFSEVQSQRNPQISKQMKFEQDIIESQYSQNQITATIPAKTLSVITNYTIQGQFVDQINGNTITQLFTIQILKSNLIVQIEGGTRIQSYLQQFQLITLAKDPDENYDWNQDPDITYQIQCINMQKQGKPCSDTYGRQIKFNSTYTQYIKANLFQPYSVIQFTAICNKGNLSTSTQSILIFLDQDIPRLNVTHPIGYLQRDININEKLYFQVELNNIDDSLIDYSYGLIYNYQTVYISYIPNRYLQFSIWDAFIQFDQITEITIRIQAHNLREFMPQMFMIKLNVNLPPINTKITIQPQYGNAYSTTFNVSALYSKDKDIPLQYRFGYYQSRTLMEQDMKNNSINNLIILQDFRNNQQYSGILESGNLLLMISIKDYFGSIVNYTQEIKVLSFYEQMNDQVDCLAFLKELVYTNIEQWIILSQELIKLYNSKIEKNCSKQIDSILQELNLKLIQYQDQTQDKNLLTRIFIVLQQFYSLQTPNQIRLIQEDQICVNLNSQYVNFTQQNFENKSDSEQLSLILHSLQNQVDQAIQDSTIYYNNIYDSLNSGDDSVQRNYLYNVNQRKNLILLLGNVFNLAFPSRLNIGFLINQLIFSFQNQLLLDSPPIRLLTKNVGVSIMKLGQSNFLKYVIQDQQYKEQINFNLEIFVSIIRYLSNIYLYTQNFSLQFNNMTFLIASDVQQDNTTTTIKKFQLIALADTPMFVPYIASHVGQNYIQMKKLNGYTIAINTQYYIQNCDQSNNTSQFVCVSYINDIWQMGYCQINYIIINKTLNEIQCICSYLSPITVMIAQNLTIITQIEKKTASLFIYQRTFIFIYDKFLLIIMISILFSFLLFIKISNKLFTIMDIHQTINDSQDTKQDMLTKAPKMSLKKYQDNLKYLHQFTRIYLIDNKELNKSQKILLCYLNFTFLATLVYIFDFVISIQILTLIVSIFSQLLLQIITKIIEGFFTGPKILSIIGYMLTISMILGQFFIISFIQGNKSEQWVLTILFIIGLLIINLVVEPIIQYLRLYFMHQIYPIMKENRLDPTIHFLYYFLQDEYILYLIQLRER